MAEQKEYPLGHSLNELDRLELQSKLFNPMTRNHFVAAGVGPGMRVLDFGCGAGDVAFLTAELVGPTGEVVGVDMAPDAVNKARERAAARGLRNVRFESGDLRKMQFEKPFDAALGRLILMYFPDPAEILREIMRHVRSGGIVVFSECDLAGCHAYPDAQVNRKAMEWMIAALEKSGAARPRMGLQLHDAFVRAGLPEPEMRLDAGVRGGERRELVCQVISETIRTLLPAIEKMGLASREEVAIDTLAKRMLADVTAQQSVMVSPLFIGAWCKKP